MVKRGNQQRSFQKRTTWKRFHNKNGVLQNKNNYHRDPSPMEYLQSTTHNALNYIKKKGEKCNTAQLSFFQLLQSSEKLSFELLRRERRRNWRCVAWNRHGPFFLPRTNVNRSVERGGIDSQLSLEPVPGATIWPIDFSRGSRFHARWWTISSDTVRKQSSQRTREYRGTEVASRRCHVRSAIRIALHLTPRNANNCRSTANKRLTQWEKQISLGNIFRDACSVPHATFRLRPR